jgi:phosphate transport system substrate-binding protein
MKHLFAAVLLIIFCAGHSSAARDEIRIVGSPDVLPYIQRVSQNFTLISEFATPSLEVTGTGKGFRLFCGGIGFEHPDINAASRRITDSEFKRCQASGVEAITEIVVGLEGIVLANAGSSRQHNFSISQLYQAAAADIQKNGKIVKNPTVYWQDIDPKLPKSKIKLMGPPPTSGIYDAFVELVMETGCREYSDISSLSASRRFEVCRNVRRDSAFVMGKKNDGLIIKWLKENHEGFGFLPLNLWQDNDSIIAVNSINGVPPSAENISNGRYTLARPIYLYVKTKHVDAVKGLQKFLYEFTSEHAIGPEGYLSEIGFIPLDDRGRNSARDSALSLAPIAN